MIMIIIKNINTRYADNLAFIFSCISLLYNGFNIPAKIAPTIIAKRKLETILKEINITIMKSTKKEIFEKRLSSSKYINT